MKGGNILHGKPMTQRAENRVQTAVSCVPGSMLLSTIFARVFQMMPADWCDLRERSLFRFIVGFISVHFDGAFLGLQSQGFCCHNSCREGSKPTTGFGGSGAGFVETR